MVIRSYKVDFNVVFNDNVVELIVIHYHISDTIP